MKKKKKKREKKRKKKRRRLMFVMFRKYVKRKSGEEKRKCDNEGKNSRMFTVYIKIKVDTIFSSFIGYYTSIFTMIRF
jgi:hypothetical protein